MLCINNDSLTLIISLYFCKSLGEIHTEVFTDKGVSCVEPTLKQFIKIITCLCRQRECKHLRNWGEGILESHLFRLVGNF